MVSAAFALLTRNLNAIRGVAENLATSTPSILKLRSSMRLLGHNLRAGPKVREKVADFLPYFRASRQSAPVDANQAYQFVAGINRNNVILRRSRSPRLADAVHQ